MPDQQVKLYVAERPGVYLLSAIYNPTVSPPTGNVIPTVGTLVIDIENDGNILYVTAVDAVTHASTLAPAKLLVESPDPELTSVVSYSNDIFRVYYDIRSQPTSLAVDTRLTIFGSLNTKYQLIRYPGTPNEVAISLYYDSNGNFDGNSVPLAPVDPTQTQLVAQYCTNCNVGVMLTDGEELRIDVYNTFGAKSASITVFAKPATILNENAGRMPVITSMTIGSTQLRSNNEIYIYEKQDISSLNLTVTLNYDTGVSTPVAIDNVRCFVYGLDDFVSSYAGLTQEIVVKYFLVNGQNVSQGLLAQSGTHITTTVNLVVIPNALAASGVKISVIPTWNQGLGAYVLNYYIYSTDRSLVSNITPNTSITSGTFNGTSYGVAQTITFTVDLSIVFPSVYSTPTPYQQQEIITLQPISILQRYVIQDASNSPYAYGVDSPSARRPVLYFDDNLLQYFVPTSLFPTSASFLASFYIQASPPFDITSETTPPTPTHFILRDIASGLSVVSAPIPLANYDVAFSITGTGGANRYVGTNVIVEFLEIINSSTTLILWGSPVDVYLSTTGYQGP